MIPTNVIAAIASVKAGNLVPIPTQIGDIAVGVLQGLSAPSELDITRKPVESGFELTDAAIDVPTTLTMDVCLTNPSYSVTSASQAALTGNPGSLTLSWRDKRDYLFQIQKDRELVNVLTHEGWYTNMLCQSIDPIFDAQENYDCYFATVVMTEVIKVSSGVAGLIDAALETKGKL